MRRFLPVVVLICAICIGLQAAAPARESWIPGVLVMPLQPRPGAAREDVPIGMALQKMVENELQPGAPEQCFWAHWTYRQIFPTRADFTSWLNGRTDRFPAAQDPRYRYLLRGWYRVDGQDLTVTLRLEDRLEQRTSSREARIRPASRNWSALHAAVVSLLRDAGLVVDAARTRRMEAHEALSLSALRSLGEGLTDYMTVFVYGNKYARYDDKAFKRAAADSPRSYVVHCFLGWVAYQRHQPGEATGQFKEALRLNANGVDALDGLVHASVKSHDPSDVRWVLAKARVQGADERVAMAELWNRRGLVFDGEARFDRSLTCYEKASALQPGVPEYAVNVASTLAHVRGFDAAIEHLDAVSARFISAHDRDVLDATRAQIEMRWAQQLYETNASEEAARHYAAALPLLLGKRPALASMALSALARCHADLGRYADALQEAEQGLTLARQHGDVANAAYALLVLGAVRRDIGDQAGAADLCGKAVALLEGIRDDRDGLRLDWVNLGVAWLELERTDKAVECFERALERAQATGDADETMACLVWTAWAREQANQLQAAAESWTRTLALAQQRHDLRRQAAALFGLGRVACEQGRLDQASVFLGRAERLYSDLRDREAEARTLLLESIVNAREKRLDAAAEASMRALAGFRAVGRRSIEAITHAQLMYIWKGMGRTPLAIFHGKMAIAAMQEIRGALGRVDRDAQTHYVKSREDVYRFLADLLISEGRLIEAQQVVELLKTSEYLDYVRSDKGPAASTSLTAREAQLEQRYSTVSGQVAALGAERERILAKATLSKEDQARLSALDADLAAANAHFLSFLQSLAAELGNDHRKLSEVKEAPSLRGDLRELGPGTVALYTVVGEDRYRVILVSPSVTVAREYPIKRVELRRLVAELRTALRDRSEDPRPAARQLYKVLVGPIEADLRQLGAQTLMWSLDDVLRYVPMAALHDGNGWLLERYRNTVFTPASPAHFNRGERGPWKVLALGVSKPAVEGFSPLPSVPDELKAVVAAGASGGRVLLDRDFTLDTFRAALYERFPVVHIASHFQFRPGDKTQSFLLLGQGSMSLADLELMSAFDRVDLLTLSACNTALGDAGATGAEVEGFAVMAQRQGAHAVLATLWSVSDRSTRELMSSFYALHADRSVSKAEALRRSQLALAKSEKYAHPFYWAPFVLIGDWK